jgi:hypothetical protein
MRRTQPARALTDAQRSHARPFLACGAGGEGRDFEASLREVRRAERQMRAGSRTRVGYSSRRPSRSAAQESSLSRIVSGKATPAMCDGCAG